MNDMSCQDGMGLASDEEQEDYMHDSGLTEPQNVGYDHAFDGTH